MNLFIRLFYTIISKLFRRPSAHILDTTHLKFTCMPHDCDYNLHMNNTRYASFCDIGRVASLMDQGVMGRLLKKGFTPIVTAQNVIHIREVKIFRRFHLESRLIGWTDKFWFFQHDFYQDGDLKATVIAKGVWVCRRKLVSFDKVLETAGYDLVSPDLPPEVLSWSEDCDQKFKKAYDQAKERKKRRESPAALIEENA